MVHHTYWHRWLHFLSIYLVRAFFFFRYTKNRFHQWHTRTHTLLVKISHLNIPVHTVSRAAGTQIILRGTILLFFGWVNFTWDGKNHNHFNNVMDEIKSLLQYQKLFVYTPWHGHYLYWKGILSILCYYLIRCDACTLI